MAEAEQKAFTTPDETRTFEKGRVDLLDIGGSAALLAETEAAANAG